jgi:hypothetical protein
LTIRPVVDRIVGRIEPRQPSETHTVRFRHHHFCICFLKKGVLIGIPVYRGRHRLPIRRR